MGSPRGTIITVTGLKTTLAVSCDANQQNGVVIDASQMGCRFEDCDPLVEDRNQRAKNKASPVETIAATAATLRDHARDGIGHRRHYRLRRLARLQFLRGITWLAVSWTMLVNQRRLLHSHYKINARPLQCELFSHFQPANHGDHQRQ
jgi:hypothetical protein